ncbi:MAG: D-alanine--D-alanine ligase [Gemmatimonadetes bacterium]|nr:D-alanine--D-alanine ligase [Gemmatimonadota bacterium]
MGPRLRIAVLMGGTSEERDVSLASGAQVSRALLSRGHDVVCVDTTRGVLPAAEVSRLLEEGVRPDPPPPETLDLLETGDATALTRAPELADTQVVFPALHGGSGEDGTLQALLDLSGLVYAGSGRLGCTLAMDKEVSKRLLRDGGIPTPDWLVGPVSLDRVVKELGLPVIIKPPSGGSTLGLTLAHDLSELQAGVEEALCYEERVLFERYVRGRELTVGIVGREALPVGEIIPAHELFDYECKYQPGLAQEIFPADIPEGTARKVQALALEVHDVLFLRDFSRVDFILDSGGNAWCLEANALPGMTANSLLPKAAAAAGISFPELCERIVQLALERSSGAGTTPRGVGLYP